MTLLNDFFDSDALNEDAMYYVEMHGFLTSLAIQPNSLTNQQILEEVFAGGSISPAIEDAINGLQKDIQQALLNGDFPDFTDAESDEDSLALWTAGFMQGVFAEEDKWFANSPEEVAELTLPILSCSGLLEDEDEDMSQNDDLLDDMAEKIPACVIDLYLLFNTPEGG